MDLDKYLVGFFNFIEVKILLEPDNWIGLYAIGNIKTSDNFFGSNMKFKYGQNS